MAKKSSLVKLFRGVFDCFASLKLAVFLLVGLGALLAVGTVIESLHGAKAAQQVIYSSTWFAVWLGALGLNVACATLDRLPWQQKHIGFVMTHAGILLILVGSWMTQRFAVDGELALAEGETGNRVTLQKPLLQVMAPHTGQNVTLPFQPTPFRWEGNRSIALPGLPGLRASLTAYYPHAQDLEKISAKAGGRPAVQIMIFNQKMRTGGWLFEGEPDRDAVNLGPAAIRFSRKTFEEDEALDARGTLIVIHEGSEIRVPVSEALSKDFAIGKTPFSLRVTRYLPHALVESGRLVNQSDEPVNPACEVVVKGPPAGARNPLRRKTLRGPSPPSAPRAAKSLLLKARSPLLRSAPASPGKPGEASAVRREGSEEAHTVFARFPDFPTIHGLKPSRTGIEIRYEFAESHPASGNELRLVYGKGRELFYQVRTGPTRSPEAPIEIGKDYPTGWMDLGFRVTAFHPEAVHERSFEPRPMPQGKSPEPAARLLFEKEGQSRSLWLTPGRHDVFFLAGAPFHVTFGMSSIPLDFEIALKDFMIEYYPGTSRPARFKSAVVLEDPSRRIHTEKLISMNEPLEHRGFKIYQSGYKLGEGGPDISIFAVGRDPGIPVKYAGSIVMVAGILVMFYLKRFSNSYE